MASINVILQRMRYWKLVLASLISLCTAGSVIGIIVYCYIEKSHYHSTSCQISECVITQQDTCTKFSTRYACYDGSFDYSMMVDNVSYSNHYTFSRTESNNYDLYTGCVNNGTILCSYDTRDIHGTFSLNNQPSLVGFIILSILISMVGVFAVLALIGSHFHHTKEAAVVEASPS